jgi:hypothetical protein
MVLNALRNSASAPVRQSVNAADLLETQAVLASYIPTDQTEAPPVPPPAQDVSTDNSNSAPADASPSSTPEATEPPPSTDIRLLLDSPTTQAQPRKPFSQGTKSYQAYGSLLGDVSGRGNTLGGATVGAGYYFLDHMAMNLELTGNYVGERGPDTAAVAGTILLRHHLYVNERFSFLWDVGGSVFEAGRNAPPNGSHFNFEVENGPGITYRLKDNLYLLTGVRFLHLSNARIYGAERNPGINTLGGYFGLMWTF